MKSLTFVALNCSFFIALAASFSSFFNWFLDFTWPLKTIFQLGSFIFLKHDNKFKNN